mgnify:CR=1 FL=1
MNHTISDAIHHSLPVGLQYEKFNIPDTIRIVDALVETLTY